MTALAIVLKLLAKLAPYEPEIAAFIAAIGHIIVPTSQGPQRVADILPTPGMSAATAEDLRPLPLPTVGP